jgi:bifunctional non-homologous end joining protein LigD
MLPTLVPAPFHRPGWIFEEKYDGYRILAYKHGERVQLLSRHGRDWTEDFREIATAVAMTPVETLILDGEVVIFDRQLVSRFELLRRREGSHDPAAGSSCG